MVGHLFGYEAALAIDALGAARCARPAKRSNSSSAQGLSGDEVVGRLNAELRLPAERFHDGLRNGTYDGHLEASTATRLSGLLRDVLSDRPIEQFQDLVAARSARRRR